MSAEQQAGAVRLDAGRSAWAFGRVKGVLALLVAFPRPLTPPLTRGDWASMAGKAKLSSRQGTIESGQRWVERWVSVPSPTRRSSRRKSLIRWQKRAAVLIHGFESR